MSDFELAIAYWVVGVKQDLTRVAVDALEQGLDSPALRILAGERETSGWGIDSLFSKAMRELDFEKPERSAAKIKIAKHYAERMVSGEMAPYEGARRIWTELCRDGDWPRVLSAFIGLANDYEDLPGARSDPNRIESLTKIEHEIMEEASSLLRTEETGKPCTDIRRTNLS